MTTKTSAPAKIILLGEHAAVYGNPVLVASVDLRTYVKVSKRADGRFILTNKATGVDKLKFSFSDFPKLKKQWSTMLTIECLERAFEKIDEKTGFDIEIWSDAPVSSGLGSSASAAAALTMALYRIPRPVVSQEAYAKAIDAVKSADAAAPVAAVTAVHDALGKNIDGDKIANLIADNAKNKLSDEKIKAGIYNSIAKMITTG